MKATPERPNKLTIMVSDAELAQLRTMAGRYGVNVSAYVRLLIADAAARIEQAPRIIGRVWK